MVVTTRSAPTLEDAQRAAETVAAHGATRVLLYGSVAKGTAKTHSDIDLVAIFDDLGDYSDRWDRQKALMTETREKVGHPVHVHVTDFPEWRKRTTEVSASFEASIAVYAVALIDCEPVVSPDWGKEIGCVDNNLEEAERRFDDVYLNCRELNGHLSPDEFEAAAEEPEDKERDRLNRMRGLCGAAARTVETSIKVLVALEGTSPEKVHDIANLLDQLHDRQRARALRQAIDAAGLTTREISLWHTKSNYGNHLEKQWAEAEEQKTGLVNLAGACALLASEAHRTAGGDLRQSNRLQAVLDKIRTTGYDSLGTDPLLYFPSLAIKSQDPPAGQS